MHSAICDVIAISWIVILSVSVPRSKQISSSRNILHTVKSGILNWTFLAIIDLYFCRFAFILRHYSIACSSSLFNFFLNQISAIHLLLFKSQKCMHRSLAIKKTLSLSFRKSEQWISNLVPITLISSVISHNCHWDVFGKITLFLRASLN